MRGGKNVERCAQELLLVVVGGSRETGKLDVIFQDLVEQRLQARARLDQRLPAFQTAEDLGEFSAPVVQAVERGELVLHHHGDADLRRGAHFHAVKAGLADADDGEGVAVDLDALAQNAGVRGKARLPIAVAQYSLRMGSLVQIIGRGKQPAQRRAHAQHAEEIARYHFPKNQLRAAVDVEAQVHIELGEHAAENLVLVSDLLDRKSVV